LNFREVAVVSIHTRYNIRKTDLNSHHFFGPEVKEN
jgi:hypothetical protein